MEKKASSAIALVIVLLFVYSCLEATEAWYFLPNYHCDFRGLEKLSAVNDLFHRGFPTIPKSLLVSNSTLTEEQRHGLFWHSVSFPHRDFVKLMPERGVFGWYASFFDIPSELLELDVIVDLGIIDDTDEAFVNGRRIGGIGEVGKSHDTAWKTERLYRIPHDNLIKEANYLAIHVWSLWGLGGIVGPPILKAAVAPTTAQWDLAFINDKNAPKGGLNGILTASDALSTVSSEEELSWQKVTMSWNGFADWKTDVHYAVFKLEFDLLREDGTPRFFSSLS